MKKVHFLMMAILCLYWLGWFTIGCAPKAPVNLTAPLKVSIRATSKTVVQADARDELYEKIRQISWMRMDDDYDYLVVIGEGWLTYEDMMSPDGLVLRRGTSRPMVRLLLYARGVEPPVCNSWESITFSNKVATRIAWKELVKWLQRWGGY